MIIKSIYVSVLIASFSLALNSCGGSASEDGKDKKTASEDGKGKKTASEDGGKKTACDCKKEAMGLMAEKDKAMGDEGKMKDLKAKMDALKESCKDYKEEDVKDCK